MNWVVAGLVATGVLGALVGVALARVVVEILSDTEGVFDVWDLDESDLP